VHPIPITLFFYSAQQWCLSCLRSCCNSARTRCAAEGGQVSVPLPLFRRYNTPNVARKLAAARRCDGAMARWRDGTTPPKELCHENGSREISIDDVRRNIQGERLCKINIVPNAKVRGGQYSFWAFWSRIAFLSGLELRYCGFLYGDMRPHFVEREPYPRLGVVDRLPRHHAA
jgi:hypothetical protein